AEHFPDAVLAQRAHAELTGTLAQVQSGAAFVNHVTHFIVQVENLEDAHAPFVTGAATLFATCAPHHLRVAELSRLNSEHTHLAFTQLRRLAAIRADPSNQSLRHDRAQR